MKRYIFHLLLTSLLLVGSLTATAHNDHGDRRRKRQPNPNISVSPDTLSCKANLCRNTEPILDHSLLLRVVSSPSERIEGIDVSHYQGQIDWETLGRRSEVAYVYIKATEGEKLKDDCYRRNLDGAKSAGLKVGSYHFYRPQVPPQVQFQNMIETVKREEQDLVPLIDIEVAGPQHGKFLRDLRQFVDLVTRYYGKRPLLYTYHNFYNKHLMGTFKSHHWMIARYHTDEPWLDDGKQFIMWQYTQRGVLPGIRGYVDRSYVMEGWALDELKL